MWFALIGVGVGFIGYLVYFGIKKFIEKKKDNKKDNDVEIV